MRTVILAVAALATVLFHTGCTAIISEQSRRLVDSEIEFSRLKENPDNYIGRHVLLGGRIAGVSNDMDGSRIEVVQFELADNGFPQDTFVSYGRFLATSSEYLDAMIYRKGMLLTLVGEVKGKRVLRLDNMEYAYPVVSIRELHLWRDPDLDRAYLFLQPPLYYNPYYYGYGYEPFWPRSYWPMIRPR